MDHIEKQLAEEKKRMESITAPEEFESRVRNALYKVPKKRRWRMARWQLVAVAILFISLVSYQYNAFAYYGKKILGFDEVMSGTLQELNDKELGQMVDAEQTLIDGTHLSINGLLLDANQLILYYTLTNEKGLKDFTPRVLTGFLTNSFAAGGTYTMNEAGTEIKGMIGFDPVSPFSKKLTLHYVYYDLQNTEAIEGTLTFPYDPNKAMETMIKKSINQKVIVDQGTINFDSITATPSMTMIEGQLNVENYDRVDFALGGVELLANAKPVELTGGGSSSSIRGTKFDIRYDRLPDKLESLSLIVKEFVGYQLLEESYSLEATEEEAFDLKGQELWVKNIKMTDDGLALTIATDEDVMLDGVSVSTGNQVTPLRTTVRQFHTKQEDGSILKERTLLFDTSVLPETLHITGMHHMKPYNVTIDIPVSK